MDGRPPSVDLDAQLRTLSAAERREVLHTLSASSADDEATVDIARFTDEDDAPISMHHVHLPKLEDTGLVRVDQERERISRGPNFDDIEPLLRAFDHAADDLPVDWP